MISLATPAMITSGSVRFAYLRDVFKRLPAITDEQKLHELLPDRWIGTHSEHQLVHLEKQANQAKERRRQRRARRRKLKNARAK